jgi:thymidylate synthase
MGMIKADHYYMQNLSKILSEGSWDEEPRPIWKDGKPAHTKFITGVFEEYDLEKGEFPITTLRNTAVKTGIKEILWIYQKQSNSLSEARDMGINWWDEWDIGDGTIGQRYGATIKRYGLVDELLNGLIKDPFGRRHIIDMYQYTDLKETPGLHPCAFMTKYSVRRKDGELYLDMTLDQRSNDYVMAGYINKIQYVALQMMVASHCGFKLGKFCHMVQNLHIYDRHFDAVKEIMDRKPLSVNPYISLETSKDFWSISIDDFKVYETEGIQKLSEKLEIAV